MNHNEDERLRAENAELRETVFRAWAVLVDWDGYWDPQTRKGDAAGLAGIVSEAVNILNPRPNDYRNTTP
jgi:hypothetical protein